MTQRAVFRGFLVCLKRMLFACILYVFCVNSVDASYSCYTHGGRNSYKILLNNDPNGDASFTNTPTPLIYSSKPSLVIAEGSCIQYLYLNANYVFPVGCMFNPVYPYGVYGSEIVIPNNPRFMGYYRSSTSLENQYINAYGGLTQSGYEIGKNYQGINGYGCDFWGHANVPEYTWYAIYAPESSIRLSADDASPQYKGKEFLFYNRSSHNLYKDYNPSNVTFSNQLTSSNNIDSLPSRNGYVFTGYWSAPSGGTQYVYGKNEANNSLWGRVTTAGFNAVNGYNGGFQTWYAQWTEVTHELSYYCADNSITNHDALAYQVQVALSTTLHAGKDQNGNRIVCNPPSGDSLLKGWACGTNWNDLSLSGATISAYDTLADFPVAHMQFYSDNALFNIGEDTICIPIWQERLSCTAGNSIEQILGQSNDSGTVNLNPVTLSEAPSNGGSNYSSDTLESDGTVSVSFTYGNVFVHGRCQTNNVGVQLLPGDPEAPLGKGEDAVSWGYCWCQVAGWTPIRGSYIELNNMPWVYSGGGCSFDQDCTLGCPKEILSSELGRTSLYTTYICPDAHIIAYDCGDDGYFSPDGIYSAAHNTQTVVESQEYTISRLDSVCKSNDGYIADTSSEHSIMGGWICAANDNSNYLDSNNYDEGGTNVWQYRNNYTCTAQWVSNTHDCEQNYYWSDVTNQCEPGYKIDLVIPNGVVQPDSGPVPTTLYTIQNTGAYLDAARTQLMVPNDTNGQGGQNPIELPVKTREIGYDTNEPTNPVTGQQYESVNPDTGVSPYVVPSTVMEVDYGCFRIPGGGQYDCAIDKTNGYITADGADNAEIAGDKTWRIQNAGYGSRYTNTAPTLTGYTCNGWYDNSEGTGSAISMIRASNLIDPQFSTLYAKWTPKTYTISYVLNNGTHGANHPESATYDSEFTVSNPTRTGYTFAGWTITGMDGVTHYYSANPIISNDVYQGATTTTLTSLSNITDTHFMNLRSATGTVTFNAQWENDTYLLTYAINAPNGLSINEPSENPVSVNAGQNRPLVAVPTGVGYTCSEWICVTSPDGAPVAVNNNTISEMPASNVLCTTSCRRNLVGLGWNTYDADNDTTVQNASPISCVYGTVDGIFPIQTPVKHGYTFVGWTISNWASGSQYNFLTLNTSDDGIERWAKAYSNSADYCWYDTNAHSASNVSCTGDSNFDELERYQWKVKFGHGDVYGISRCSSTSGTNNETGNPLTNAGKYCWCMATGYKQSNSSALNGPATEMPWVMCYTGSDTSVCRKNCAAYCSYHTEYTPDFRSVLYGL